MLRGAAVSRKGSGGKIKNIYFTLTWGFDLGGNGTKMDTHDKVTGSMAVMNKFNEIYQNFIKFGDSEL
jgi:hypothetical protein